MRMWLLLLLLAGTALAGPGPGQTYLNYLAVARNATSCQQLAPYFPVERQAELASLPPQDDKMMLGMMRGIAPSFPKVVSERIVKDKAQVVLTGKVNGKTVDGKAEMVRQKGTWRILSESWAARK